MAFGSEKYSDVSIPVNNSRRETLPVMPSNTHRIQKRQMLSSTIYVLNREFFFRVPYKGTTIMQLSIINYILKKFNDKFWWIVS